MRFTRLVALVAALASACAAGAQEARASGPTSRYFEVTPRGGYLRFDRASSIQSAPFLGFDAAYRLTPMFSIGTNLVVSRAETHGEDFLTSFRFGDASVGDTILILAAQQPVTLIDLNLGAQARLPAFGRITPFVNGGIGGYTLYLDPQSNGRPERFSRMSINAGAGLQFAVGRYGGFQLDVRDMIFTDFKRTRLNPTEPRFANLLFIEDLPQPPEAKSTVHNFQVSLGFTFRPQGQGGTADVTGTDEETER